MSAFLQSNFPQRSRRAHGRGPELVSLHGRAVHLCWSHSRSFDLRRRRGLSLKLIQQGWCSAYNQYGYGSTVTSHERIDWLAHTSLKRPTFWLEITYAAGNVPMRWVAMMTV
jgi:hypothetical protein